MNQGFISRRFTGVVFGNLHFITLDGLSYTFNGKGEYQLVSSADKELSVQARTAQVQLENGESTFNMTALFVSAAAALLLFWDLIQTDVCFLTHSIIHIEESC